MEELQGDKEQQEKQEIGVKQFRESVLKNPEMFQKLRPLLVLDARREQQTGPYDKLWEAILNKIPRWMFEIPQL